MVKQMIGCAALAVLIASGAARAATELAPVGPAEVVVLALADLGLPDGADAVSVSGAVTEARLVDGALRFLTPCDAGVTQRAEFTLVKGNVRRVLVQPILSVRPTAPLAHEDAAEEAAPRLTVAGLGPGNTFIGEPLTFRLDHRAGLDLERDSDGLILGADGVRISLRPYWVFDRRSNSFTIGGARLARLMAALPAGALDVSINLVSKDGAFAAAYDLLATSRGATLAGRLVTPQGDGVRSLAGRKMLLAGVAHRLRRVAVIDAAGAFTFANVIPDTYRVVLADLDRPDTVAASAVVVQGAAVAEVTVVYSKDP